MKKIVFTSILVAVIILTVVISGILVVNYLLNRVYDVEFLSVDKEASVILKGASYEEEKNHFEFSYHDRLDFYPTVKDVACPQMSQSIPEDLVFTECLNFHAEDRLTPRWHGGQPCGKASWEIL